MRQAARPHAEKEGAWKLRRRTRESLVSEQVAPAPVRSAKISDAESACREKYGIGRRARLERTLQGQALDVRVQNGWNHQHLQHSRKRRRGRLRFFKGLGGVGSMLMTQHGLCVVHAFASRAIGHCLCHRFGVVHAGADITCKCHLREKHCRHQKERDDVTMKRPEARHGGRSLASVPSLMRCAPQPQRIEDDRRRTQTHR